MANRPVSLPPGKGPRATPLKWPAQGIVTRGVLLDITRVRGADWLEPTDPVMPEDLEAAERLQGVRVEEGDILLVRTGNYRMRLETGRVPNTQPSTACQVACTPWFKERGVAMLGTDTSNDIRPSHYATVTAPLHTVSLVTLGMWLIDNTNLEQLAEACAERGRYEFMLSLGAFGSAERNRQSGKSDSDFLEDLPTQSLGAHRQGRGETNQAVVKLCFHLSGCMLNSCSKELSQYVTPSEARGLKPLGTRP